MTIIGDPTLSGASLQVIANGASATTQTFSLNAAGWTSTPLGYRYTGPTTGDPVRRVVYKRTASGVAVITAVLRGSVGTTDLAVTPPNPGDDGGLVLQVGGDRFCVSLGGAAGGTETKDDAAAWSIRNATATPGCPVSTVPTTTSTSSTSSTTLAACGATSPACDGECPPSYHCESAGGTCFCITGGSNLCTVCDPPCSGGQVCHTAVNPDPMQYTAYCGCVTPPVCVGLACGGSCPAGSTCMFTTPGTSCNCYYFP